MKTGTEYWVVLNIIDTATGETSYAGSIDDLICYSLTSQGNERFGKEQGLKNYESFELDVDGLFESFTHEEYGYVMYALAEMNYNFLKLKLDSYVDPNTDKRFKKWVETIKTLDIPYPDPYGFGKETKIYRIAEVFLEIEKIQIETILL